MRTQTILAKGTLVGFAIGAAVALAACLGARFGAFAYDRGLEVLIPGVAIGVVGLVAGLVWLWRALEANDSKGWCFGGAGLIGCALLVGIPADHLWLSYSLPPIHDISTDIGDAPRFETLLAWRKGAPNPPSYDGPNMVTYGGERMTTALAQKYAYPDIRPMEKLNVHHKTVPLKEYYASWFWRCLNTVNGLGWQVASFDLKSGRIEATDTSLWFGIVSDIVIRVRTAGSIGVRIDVRAKSRMGTADMGRNATLVRDFLHAMPP
jgi:hypothetical protein